MERVSNHGHGTRTMFGFLRYCLRAYSKNVGTESGAGLLYHNIQKPLTKKNAGSAGNCMPCLLFLFFLLALVMDTRYVENEKFEVKQVKSKLAGPTPIATLLARQKKY